MEYSPLMNKLFPYFAAVQLSLIGFTVLLLVIAAIYGTPEQKHEARLCLFFGAATAVLLLGILLTPDPPIPFTPY